MDEVERIARLMYAVSARHYGYDPNSPTYSSFDATHEHTRDGYLALARAVLADLCPQPIVVEAPDA